jgi:hypothetical protein
MMLRYTCHHRRIIGCQKKNLEKTPCVDQRWGPVLSSVSCWWVLPEFVKGVAYNWSSLKLRCWVSSQRLHFCFFPVILIVARTVVSLHIFFFLSLFVHSALASVCTFHFIFVLFYSWWFWHSNGQVRGVYVRVLYGACVEILISSRKIRQGVWENNLQIKTEIADDQVVIMQV